MVRNELTFVYNGLTTKVHTFNTYQYSIANIIISGGVECTAYIPSSMIKRMSVGSVYYSNMVYITAEYNDDNRRSIDVCFRIDRFTESGNINLSKSGRTSVRINVLIEKDRYIKYGVQGPMSTPFVICNAISRREDNTFFKVMLMGFYGKVNLIKNLPNKCFVDVIGYITRRDANKPCYIVVDDVIIRKEYTS